MNKETIIIDGVRYYADRPQSCRGCFFWKNRKVGCSLKKENCYYLAESPKPTSPCVGCCYGPCVSFCMKKCMNIFENSDFVYMLNQAAGDRQILAKQLNISQHQLSYVTHSGEGEGLLFYGNVILPFVDRFPQDTELYRIMTTKLSEVSEAKEA